MKRNRKKILLDCPFKKDTEKSLDSAQYDTERNLTQRSMILHGTSKKFEYLGENVTKFEIELGKPTYVLAFVKCMHSLCCIICFVTPYLKWKKIVLQ